MATEFPPTSFEEVPIIFVSTHGVYDLTEEPKPFVVPDNVYIFETQTIGDVCLTSIDKPLWNLMNNREAFIAYFKGMGTKDLAKEVMGSGVYARDHENQAIEHHFLRHDDYKAVFRNMHFYQPGDTIYNRTLSIGGGGDGARRSYANMGFYRFDVGDPVDRYPDGPASRIRELQPLRTKLIGDENETTSQKEVIEMMLQVQPDTAEGSIFIFSSCAAFWKQAGETKVSVPVLNRRLELIEKAQQAADLALMQLTPAGPSGAGTNDDLEDMEIDHTGRNLSTRNTKQGRAVFAPNADTASSGTFFRNDNADFEARMQNTGENVAAPVRTARGKSVFVKNPDGSFKQIATPLTAGSAKPDLLFSARNLRDAKKAYGEVYGFSKSRQSFHLLGGSRRVTRKAVPRLRRRLQTRRRF